MEEVDEDEEETDEMAQKLKPCKGTHKRKEKEKEKEKGMNTNGTK